MCTIERVKIEERSKYTLEKFNELKERTHKMQEEFDAKMKEK